MKTKTYSSETVRALMENDIYSFWKKDWSKRIQVKWDRKIPLSKLRRDVERMVGRDFMFELAISLEKSIFVASKNGLTTKIFIK